MAHHLIMLCSYPLCLYSYSFIRACRTLPSSPSPPRHCCLRRHYRCRHIVSCRHCSHRPYHCPCRRLPVFPSSVVNCCRSHHRLVVVSSPPPLVSIVVERLHARQLRKPPPMGLLSAEEGRRRRRRSPRSRRRRHARQR
jgi:hypothetical protein